MAPNAQVGDLPCSCPSPGSSPSSSSESLSDPVSVGSAPVVVASAELGLSDTVMIVRDVSQLYATADMPGHVCVIQALLVPELRVTF